MRWCGIIIVNVCINCNYFVIFNINNNICIRVVLPGEALHVNLTVLLLLLLINNKYYNNKIIINNIIIII